MGPAGLITVGGPIARLLLVQLTIARGRVVPDDEAIDAIWGQAPPDSVAAALRVHVAQLRGAVRVLGWRIERLHHGYALAGDPSLDTQELERAESTAAAAATEDGLAAADRGLALWRGPSLADVRRMPLGERLAASLDRRRESLLTRQMQLLLGLGRAREALPTLDRLVREDPLDETRWALRAEALYRGGHPAEALRSLEQARTALAEEAGLLPGPALQDMQRRILNHEVEAVPPVQESPRPGRRPARRNAELDAQTPGRLYGRVAELTALAELLTAATASGVSSVARVCGESGAGKSALVSHFARIAADHGCTVLYGWADQDATAPLGPLRGPLAELMGHGGVATGVLAPFVGWPEPPVSIPVPANPTEPTRERARILDAVRRTLAEGHPDRPLLLVLDDVQWADELTVAAIRSIARFPLLRRLVLLVVERSEESSATAGRGITEVPVGPLTAAEIAPWARREPDDAWVTRLVALTGGLPLLLQDVLDRPGGAPDLSTLRESIGRRLLQDRSAGLPPTTARALVIAAVLGQSFGFDDVLSLSGAGELQLVEDLDAAVRSAILSYDPNDPSVFRFSHDLLRMAVLQDITPLRRMRLHGEVIARISGLPALRALHHAQEAGRFVGPGDLAAIAIKATSQLLDTFGFESASRIAAGTLDSVGAQLTPRDRARLLTLLGRAEVPLGQTLRARAHLAEALGHAEAADDPELVAEVVRSEGLFGPTHAQDPDAPARLEKLLSRLPESARDSRYAVLRMLIFTYLSGGRLEEAAAVLPQAWALATELGDPEREAALHYLDHWHAECAGDLTRRAGIAALAGELAARQGGTLLRMRYLCLGIIESLHHGDTDSALGTARELTELGIVVGQPYEEWLGLVARFPEAFCAGRLSAAHDVAQRAFDRGSQSELFGVASAYGAQLFCLGWVSGRLDAFTSPAEGENLPGPQLAWRAVRALAFIVSGRQDVARAELPALRCDIEAAGTHWIGFVGVALAVEVAAALDAPDILALAEPILSRRVYDHVLLGTGAIDLGPVARYLGLALLGLGRSDDGRALLHAVRADPRSGSIWQQRAAVDLVRAGDPLGLADVGPWSWLLAPQ